MTFETARPEIEPFEFRGDTYEWLGIWIVNLFLSIITFGIYSAWAKVRMRKYFYQNTWVAGRNFDYHATGLQIFIGRVIVIVGLTIYSFLANTGPVMAVVMPLILLAVLPWLLVKALRFNAVMSSWSNVRFGFDGRAVRAFLVFILPYLGLYFLIFGGILAVALVAEFSDENLVVVALPTLIVVAGAVLLWPFIIRLQHRFVLGNHRLGTAPFAFSSTIGPFYLAFLAMMAWIFACLVVATMIFGAAAYAFISGIEAGNEPEPAQVIFLIIGLYAFLFIALIPADAIYKAFIRNVLFNGTTLDNKHRLQSDMQPLRYAWILFSNAIAVLLSLGLMLPWAHIREARYSAQHTRLLPGGSLDDFLGELAARATALGDAYADLEGIDIGLPL